MFYIIKKYLKKILPAKLFKLIKKAGHLTSWLIFYYFKSARPPIPDTVYIDPVVNICNLHCSFCPTGINKLNYDKSMMLLDTFKTIIKKMPGLKRIFLFHWGEPFLNPDIFKFIKYAKERNIKATIHSNFSLDRDDSFFTDIVESGLNYLTLSIDGASKDTYSKCRFGGDFNLVISNIKRLTQAKRQLKSTKPVITWKFIVTRLNEGEIKLAKIMAKDLGINFQPEWIWLYDLPDAELDDTIEQRKELWLPKDREFVLDCYTDKCKSPLYEQPCRQLFSTLYISPDGKVFPCCYMTDMSNVFGDLLKDSIDEIWNNSKYLYSRSLFLSKEYRGPREQTVCLGCNYFKQKQRKSR
jgi:radical SAM protein with 4Fe4S-binding SPASM domain